MIIDGKKISLEIQAELKNKIALLSGRKPGLAVIIVGSHPASSLYVKRKIEACQIVGIHSKLIELPSNCPKETLLAHVGQLNKDPEVDGILIQLPLPPHMNPLEINAHIDPEKDVDGFHPVNMGKLLMGEKGGFIPCTPLGIQALIQRSGFTTSGKHVAIIGRSMTVGKPMAALLMQHGEGGDATVSLLHSKSKQIPEICRLADIIIVAIGNPLFLTKEMVKKEAVVIDVGINRVADVEKKFKIVGDADFHALKDYCQAITPVPGGVGPMTIAMLLSNTVTSFQKKSL